MGIEVREIFTASDGSEFEEREEAEAYELALSETIEVDHFIKDVYPHSSAKHATTLANYIQSWEIWKVQGHTPIKDVAA